MYEWYARSEQAYQKAWADDPPVWVLTFEVA